MGNDDWMNEKAKPPRKFMMDHALTVTLDWAGILAPGDLEEAAAEPAVPPSNIYLIGRRPRVSVVPGTFECSSDLLRLQFQADWGDGDPALATIDAGNPWQKVVTLASRPPHTRVTFHDAEGVMLAGFPSATLLSMFMSMGNVSERLGNPGMDGNFLDLEVVYVGQSLDEGGALGNRLLHHGTLQKILAKNQQYTPHLEVWVILMQFAGYNNIGAMGPGDYSKSDEDSLEHIKSIHATELTLTEITALVEAALIRYFQPEYNNHFKYAFPKPLHTSYKSVYDLDYSAVGFEFESLETVGCRLMSPAVGPNFFHTALFALRKPDEHRRFFDFWDEPGSDIAAMFYVKRDEKPPS